ncbi:poly-gamma-glutamate hydrolase family protein [Staphylococcus sp. NRL 18/288]|nr:poly-gamma-glutamate hydrolase family protein [Staphylococcus sp. NRL 18/288]MCJ1661261.1 poly-gamma-glutamate hydrolase family protein [Staphylococcus sp. NRL 18/288]
MEPPTPIKPVVPHKDHFRSMTQLFANTKEGVDWKKEIKKTGSNVIIVAPHGGNIEKGTTELTKMVAKHNHYDYYSFTVLSQQNPEKFHVTSSHYNDPTLLNMVKSKDFAVSIHGAKGDKPVIYLGGLDTELKEAIKQQLLKQHFTVKIAPSYLGGDLKQNFVNRDFKDKGVQLELTTAFRKSLFINEDMSPKSRANKKNWSPVMYKFSDALDKAIKQVDDSGKDR